MNIGLNSVLRLNNGVNIPIFGFGTYLVKTFEPIEYALKCGIRHIDSASLYENEEMIGKYLKDQKIPRESIFVTSKLRFTYHGYENTLKGFEQSYKSFGLDYIDLYLVHWPDTSYSDNSKARKETWKAMEEIYSSGKVKAVGVSNYTLSHLKEKESYSSVIPSVNQVEYHILNQQKEVVEYCKNKGIQIISFRSLGNGKLLENPVVKELGKKHNKTEAQVLLRFCIEGNIGVIPKSSSEERIKKNTEIFDFSLDEKDMRELKEMNQEKYLSTFSFYGKTPDKIE